MDVIKTRGECLGATNEVTLKAKLDYAFLLRLTKKYEKEEKVICEVIRAKEEVLGPNNEATLWVQLDYAFCLYMMKRKEEAKKLCKDVMKRTKEHLGPDNFIIKSAENLMQYLP